MTVKTLGAGRPVSSAAELDSGVYRVHGVAIGNNDVTVGKSGVPKRWTPEALQAAAETLEGQPIVKNHENRDVDAVIGQVTEAAYREDTGVVYEGELDDREIAEKVDRGRLQVSPRVFHRKVDELELDEDEGVLIIGENDIRRFDNLSIVTKGAAPSNSIDRGAAAALSQEQIAEEFDVELPEEPVETDEELEDDEDGQRDVGEIVRETLAELEAEDNDPSDDARQEDNEQSTRDADNSNLTMENEELMERLEAEARLADAPANELTLVPEHEVEELRSDNEELAEEKEDLEDEVEELSEAKEDLESEIEEMEDEIETVKEAYAKTLAASESALEKEDFMERFKVEELRERYEALQDSDDRGEELAPDPQSGDPDDPEEELEDELTPEEERRIEELEQQIETFENRGGAWAKSAEDAREELEELRGE